MPYLMLEFKAEREMNKSGVATGKDHIMFRMIDTDTGKVVELEADARNIKETERPANFGESHTASQVLGQEPGQQPSQRWRDQMNSLEAERDSWRQKATSAKATIDKNNTHISSLQEDLSAARQQIKNSRTSPIETELIAEALDTYIVGLAESQQFESYEVAKKVYKRLTGRSWADDGSDDDDLEDDPAGPRFQQGGFIRGGAALDLGDLDHHFAWRWMMKDSRERLEKLEREQDHFWHFHWDEIETPDIAEDMRKFFEFVKEDGRYHSPPRRLIPRSEYERMLKEEEEREMQGLEQFGVQFFKLEFKDSQFKKNIEDLEQELHILGRKAGKTTMTMELLRKAQLDGYNMYFKRESKRPTRIKNFRLDGKQKGRKRQIPKSNRDIVDQRQRWKQDRRQKQRNPGR